MKSVADIFDKLGGPSGVARILDCGASTAGEMKRRGSIPVRYWPVLIASTQGKLVGLTSDILMAANAPSKSEVSA